MRRHYKPFSYWWCSPAMVVAIGIGFIVSANLMEEPCLRTTVVAAAPVSLIWFIYLYVLPTQFKRFANDYIASHPEVAPATAEEASRTSSDL